MKALLIIFSLICNFIFSQYITGLNLTQNGNGQIKANLKVYLPTVGNFLSSTTTINQNVITLSACYFMTDFGGVSNLSNDFYINIADNNNYILKVNMYSSNNPNNCNYQNLEDTATLNFTTPIQGTVSLAANESDVSEQDLKLFPIPAKDELIIITKNRINNINVLDASGRKVSATFLNNKVNTSNLQNGIYFIEIFSDKGLARKKFTIKK